MPGGSGPPRGPPAAGSATAAGRAATAAAGRAGAGPRAARQQQLERELRLRDARHVDDHGLVEDVGGRAARARGLRGRARVLLQQRVAREQVQQRRAEALLGRRDLRDRGGAQERQVVLDQRRGRRQRRPPARARSARASVSAAPTTCWISSPSSSAADEREPLAHELARRSRASSPAARWSSRRARGGCRPRPAGRRGGRRSSTLTGRERRGSRPACGSRPPPRRDRPWAPSPAASTHAGSSPRSSVTSRAASGGSPGPGA